MVNRLVTNTNYAIALEMLEFPDTDNRGMDGAASMCLPLLAARSTYNLSNGGRVMIGGSAYELRWDGMENGPTDSKIGYGFLFGGRTYLAKTTYFIWNASAGEGWGSNIASMSTPGRKVYIQTLAMACPNWKKYPSSRRRHFTGVMRFSSTHFGVWWKEPGSGEK